MPWPDMPWDRKARAASLCSRATFAVPDKVAADMDALRLQFNLRFGNRDGEKPFVALDGDEYTTYMKQRAKD